ncbi:MAG: hypothetical protein HeimC3_24880 [Candidatus Heimdallarchaeota archaeon LC_3]|nr:MAG: hypothetical protein HeimC3_24880 [Candidatus Heimdallarchaeota archaeon LC_3]
MNQDQFTDESYELNEDDLKKLQKLINDAVNRIEFYKRYYMKF